MSDANVVEACPFLWVDDMDASLKFYIDGLGFGMTCSWAPEGKVRWCSLKFGGASLMLQEFNREGHDANLPTDKVGVGFSICFICRDALALYQEFVARGLRPSEPFVGNGMWVVPLTDPDGYRLEFESETGVAEETRYSAWLAADR